MDDLEVVREVGAPRVARVHRDEHRRRRDQVQVRAWCRVLPFRFPVRRLGIKVLGLRFRVWGLGFGIWGLGFEVWVLGFGFWGLGFGVLGLGFGVRGLGFENGGVGLSLGIVV